MDLTLSETEEICRLWDYGEFDELRDIFENITWSEGTEFLTEDKQLAFKLLFYSNIMFGDALEVWKVLHRYGSYQFSEIYIDLCKSKFPELYNKALPAPTDMNFRQSFYNPSVYDGGFKEIADLYSKLDSCNQNEERVHNYIKGLIYDAQVNNNADALFKLGYLQANNLNHFEQSLETLENAIIINPNKALYWGFYNILGLNIAISPESGLYYINKAIELDPDTLFWKLFRITNLAAYCGKKSYSADFSTIDVGLFTAISQEFNNISDKINVNDTHFYELYLQSYQALLNQFGNGIKSWLHLKQASQQLDTLNFPFYSKLAGVSYDNRQFYLSRCNRGDQLTLIREPDNLYDRNAIAVYHHNVQLGFIKKNLAEKLAPYLDQGHHIICTIAEITGGDGYLYGANIRIDLENRW